MNPPADTDASFLDEYPEYRGTQALDDLRRTEYERLDRLGHHYLDYTGAGLYASTQVREHMRLLLQTKQRTP